MTTQTEILEMINALYQKGIPFHDFINLETLSLSPEKAEIRIEMRPELVGNPIFKTLHGGVTATLLDAVGGMVATASVLSRMEDLSPQRVQNRLSRLGTIDLRVDYLRPGRGKTFTASSCVIRRGNKVAVTRMELHSDTGEEIALGTATYLVG